MTRTCHDGQKQLAVKSGEIPVGFNISTRSHTFHKPTKIATLSFGISKLFIHNSKFVRNWAKCFRLNYWGKK